MVSRRTKTILRVISIVLTGVVVWWGWDLLYILRGLPDAYAMWDAGDLIVDYMGKHSDQWPSGWEELKRSFEACKGGDGEMRGQTFDGIRNRIQIDWQASPQNALLHHTAFNSVTAKSGNHTTWEGAEPNEMIIQYLRKHVDTAPSSRPDAPKSTQPVAPLGN